MSTKKAKNIIHKFLRADAGVSLLETIMALGILSLIFSVLFSVFGNMSRSFSRDTKEIKVSQQVWEKLALCMNDIQKSDLLMIGDAGKQLILFNSRKGDKTIYEFKKDPTSRSDQSSGNYLMVKKRNAGAGKAIVLRNILPPPKSQFLIIHRAIGPPLAVVKVAIQDKGIIVKKSICAFPRGLL